MVNKLLAVRMLIGAACVAMAPLRSLAATGEMGTGVPDQVGLYSAVTGVATYVWSISDVTIPFPSGCSSIALVASTMGMDAYKLAVNTVLLAKVTNRRVRFHSHVNSGCQVDYVQLM